MTSREFEGAHLARRMRVGQAYEGDKGAEEEATQSGAPEWRIMDPDGQRVERPARQYVQLGHQPAEQPHWHRHGEEELERRAGAVAKRRRVCDAHWGHEESVYVA